MNMRAQFMQDEDIDMSPMIDMVFLLIIFFMVASHLNQLERPEINVPIAKNAAVPEDLEGRRNITVKADGKIYLGNAPRELSQIKPAIEKHIKVVPNLKIYLRADQQALHKDVRDVMKACADAGALDIIFATYETAN